MLIEPGELLSGGDAVVFDCRFSLADPQEGRRLYTQGHIPGAHYLDLNRDMAGQVGEHGGRHPLPEAAEFAALLSQFGVGPTTEVVAYDDSRLAFAARLWWLMRALGYRPPRLLNGGYAGYLQAGGRPETHTPEPRAPEIRDSEAIDPETSAPSRRPFVSGVARNFKGYCDIDAVRVAQLDGALLVDSREPRRYAGLEEPIDPIAGHIPGAVNRPWQGVTGADGRVLDAAGLRAHWGDALDAERLVVYCGSGVTACVNLFSLALLGREDATLYAGSWSDWCSYLQNT
jgi:thiosulfate/3-mercaptopyruvate sulfurtransferase